MKKLLIIIPLFILTIAATITGFVFLNHKNEPEVSVPQVSDVDVVYDTLKDEGISKEFLKFIDEKYAGAIKKIKTQVETEKYSKDIWHKATGNSLIVLNDLFEKKYDDVKNVRVIDGSEVSTLSFVGDVSLADNWPIAPQYDRRGGIKGILGDKMLKMMTETDLMVVNSEFTVSNRGSALKGKTYTFRAKPERLKIYDEMGVDLVSLANNHVYDYGKDAFLDMLDAFSKYDIPNVGAGRNIKEASEPFYFVINGYKFAFIAATRAEKHIFTAGATETDPGVFRCYDPTGVINKIKEIRETADYVIPMIHFGRENSHQLEKEQVESAKQYIDAGADVVIGHHAHTLQGIEFYKDKPIVYNLGNFLFNEEEVETGLFQIELSDSGEMEYYFYPALQKNMKTELLDGTRKQKIINNMNSWSIGAKILSDGKVEKK